MNEHADPALIQEAPETVDLAADLDETSLMPWMSEDGFTPPEPPEFPTRDFNSPPAPEHVTPSDAACAKDAHKRIRREQMKEYATQLWIGGPQTPTAVCDPHLICILADEDFALPLANILEVQRLPAVTPVPFTPPWLIGVTNRRGDVLSVVDLAAFLGREAVAPSSTRRLVVVKASREGLTTGLTVDRVRGIRGLEDKGPTVAVLDLDNLLLSPRMRRLELDGVGA